jgi:hypothetical protein
VGQAGALVVPAEVVLRREVGRTAGAGPDGAADEAVGEVGAAPVVAVAGHSTEPQARSVAQQPPPREAGQVRKPVEQVRVCGGVVTAAAADVGVGVGVVLVLVGLVVVEVAVAVG